MSHTSDEQCTLDESGCRTECGVGHGDPCRECGGSGFHRPDCIELVPGFDEAVGAIAGDHLGIDRLREQGADPLDFYYLHVCSIRSALAAAYQAGMKASRG